MAFPQSTGRTEIETLSLSQIEGLKGENLQLKLDSADKQMRLLQEQYARLAELQAALVRQLQELERELLAARGLSPADWSVNWQAKQIEKSEVRSQKSESEPRSRPAGTGPSGSGQGGK